MAKILDKLYNRVIEGKLIELSNEDLEALKDNGINQTPSYELGDVEDIENVIDSLRVGDTVSITGTLYVVTYIDSAQVNLLQLDGLGSLSLAYLTYDIGAKDLSTDIYNLATQNDVGTKLYQHRIGLDESGNNLAVIVSNRQTPYTSEDIISLDNNVGVVSIFVYDDGNAVRAVCSTLNLTSGYYIGADGNSMSLDYYAFKSDEVTPL